MNIWELFVKLGPNVDKFKTRDGKPVEIHPGWGRCPRAGKACNILP
ncbi:MAG: hypothetical protein CM1200mP30_18710 [Pseudomonadota bacterium]|nr:MAG: hypothetical protein CM1200mP30_18710 [Pseudomonadota bacterium]